MQSDKFNYCLVIALILFIVFAYLNSLSGNFVSDDKAVMASFSRQEPSFLKPVFSISNFVDVISWRLFALRPFGYHLVNLILHILNVILVFLTIFSLFGRRKLAFITALLFAVHPVNTQVVSWISGKPYAQMSLFFLMAVSMHKRLVISIISFLLSLTIQVGALGMPFLLLVYHRNKKKTFYYFAALLLSIPFLSKMLFKRIAMFDSLSAGVYIWPAPGRIVAVFRVLFYYLKLAVFPLKLGWYHSIGFDYNKNLENFNLAAVGSILAVCFLIFLAFKYRNKSREFSFGIAWFFITLLPCLNIIYTNSVIAERYLYLPLIGFCLALASLLEKLPMRIAVTLTSIILSLLFIRTIIRNKDYKNEFTLYYSNTIAFPDTYMSHNSLGGAYTNLGKYELAAQEFKKAIELNPSYEGAYYNLGNTYLVLGRISSAYLQFKKSLSLNPNFELARENLSAIENFKQ